MTKRWSFGLMQPFDYFRFDLTICLQASSEFPININTFVEQANRLQLLADERWQKTMGRLAQTYVFEPQNAAWWHNSRRERHGQSRQPRTADRRFLLCEQCPTRPKPFQCDPSFS